jgi:hypothetical protein
MPVSSGSAVPCSRPPDGRRVPDHGPGDRHAALHPAAGPGRLKLRGNLRDRGGVGSLPGGAGADPPRVDASLGSSETRSGTVGCPRCGRRNRVPAARTGVSSMRSVPARPVVDRRRARRRLRGSGRASVRAGPCPALGILVWAQPASAAGRRTTGPYPAGRAGAGRGGRRHRTREHTVAFGSGRAPTPGPPARRRYCPSLRRRSRGGAADVAG